METVGDDNPIAHCQPIHFNPSKTVALRRKNLKEKKMASLPTVESDVWTKFGSAFQVNSPVEKR
jgi:hypothetical protein